MNRNQVVFMLLGATAFLVVMTYLGTRTARQQEVSAPVAWDPKTAEVEPTPDAATPVAQHVPTRPDGSERVPGSRLDSALASLRAATNAIEARRILAELHADLASLPRESAAAGIGDFLSDPARDTATGIEFSVGRAGFLEGHPSLRVALLDWLGQIDSEQAGIVAETILATPTHPDEWAVCLRNYARANPTSDSYQFLRAKTEELIRNAEWRERPSVGFLEAFDVLVYTHATESTGLLGGLVADRSPEGKALAHAAYLTLDRLTIREPTAILEQLTALPELIQARGPMVANLVARADLRDPEQRQLAREYLLDPARTSEELTAFAGIYPNANFAISNNLLTETRTPTREELVAHDAAVLEIVTAWADDPSLESVRPYLDLMQERLATFVRQAAK